MIHRLGTPPTAGHAELRQHFQLEYGKDRAKRCSDGIRARQHNARHKWVQFSAACLDPRAQEGFRLIFQGADSRPCQFPEAQSQSLRQAREPLWQRASPTIQQFGVLSRVLACPTLRLPPCRLNTIRKFGGSGQSSTTPASPIRRWSIGAPAVSIIRDSIHQFPMTTIASTIWPSVKWLRISESTSSLALLRTS